MFIKKTTLSLLILILSLTSFYALADSAQDKADLAVANILFDFSQGDEEYASYRTDEDGYAYVSFALNIPDKLYSDILTTMQNHPEIRDVIFDKGGPRCKLW